MVAKKLYPRTKPRLEITTPAVRNPGVTVELEPGGVSGTRKKTESCYSCVAGL